MEDHDPEVSLAVRLRGDDVAQPDVDSENGLDEFISNHGFEYIDGDRGGRDSTRDGGEASTEDQSGLSYVCLLLTTFLRTRVSLN